MTDSYELAEVTRDALRAITSGGATVFSTVEVTVAALEQILAEGVRLPAALVRVGGETHSPDVRSSSQEIEVELVVQVEADRFGSGAVLGHGDVKGLLELQQLVYTALQTSLGGDGAPLTAWSASETAVVEVGDGRAIAVRLLRFEIEAKGGALAQPAYEIVYGTTTFNSASAAVPRGKPRVYWDAATQIVECEVMLDVAATTAAALQTACSSLVTALTARNKLLTITMSGQTQHTWTLSDSVAGWAGATLEQVGERDSPTFRQYRFVARYYLTAAASGTTSFPGLAVAEITYTLSPSRRVQVQIQGEVRRLPGASPAVATAAYLASEATYSAAVIGASFSSYRKIAEEYAYDDGDNALRFTVVYQEVLAGQTVAPVTHASVTEQTYEVSVGEGLPAGVTLEGRIPAAGKTVSCSWSGAIAKTETDLRAFYAAQVQSALREAMTAAAAGPVYIDPAGEQVTIDAAESRISASLSGFSPGATIVSADVEVTILGGSGWGLAPRATGLPHDYTLMREEAEITRSVRATFLLSQPPSSVSPLWRNGGVGRAAAVAEQWLSPSWGSAVFCAALPLEADEEGPVQGPLWQQPNASPCTLSARAVERYGHVWTELTVQGEQVLVVSGQRVKAGFAPGWKDRAFGGG